ncbi:MAG: hypothetical protein NTX45_02340 [Proteobacteria bacterium]|nr:hypothetical protein [Pseudomonadota bacterium]
MITGSNTTDVVTGITLASGQSADNNNFGEIAPASIKGNVYSDANNDGSRTGDTGLGSVSVTLTGTNDLNQAVSITKATNPDGSYSFDVSVHSPLPFPGNAAILAAISAGETPSLPGGGERLRFDGLRPGSYSVAETTPAGYLDGKDTAGTGSTSASVGGNDIINVTLAAGQTSVENNFGELLPAKASIGDHVWSDCNGNGIQDAGEGGIAGITVKLLNSTGQVVATDVTDTNGDYLFSGLDAGTFSVSVIAPIGYQFTSQNQGGDDTKDSDVNAGGLTAQTVLVAGENDLSWDAGLRLSATANAPDVVFNFSGNTATDGTDGNIRTFTDASSGLSVNVSAFSENKSTGAWATAYLGSYGGGLGVTDRSEGTGSGNAHTVDNTGGYDNYVMFEFNKSVVLDKAFLGYVVNDSDTQVWIGNFTNPYTSHLTLNDATLALMGFTQVDTTTLTTTRWADLNANNYAGNVLVIAADTTDMSPEDNFKIQNMDVALKACAPNPAHIGDRVWFDANGNGVQDTGENGFANVTVQLKDSSGVVVGTTTTDASGNYGFDVAPGSYSVKVVAPTGYAVTTQNAGADDAKDSDVGSTGETALYTLAAGANNLTVDAGLKVAPVATASLGDRVWLDTNANGVQDTTETAGVVGVKVTLTGGGLDGKLSTTGDNTTATTTTDATGKYGFSGLTAGEYQVKFDASTATGPAYFLTKQDGGTSDAVDSDANRTTGLSQVVTLATGENNTTVDAGVYQKASLGDKVWDDMNHNYVQDASEPGIGGIRVTLWTAGANGVYDNGTGDDIKVANTTTNSTGSIGNYLFSNLDPGDYYLMFDKANVMHYNATYGASYNMSTWKWAPKDTGTNDAIDSDVTGNGVATTDVTSTSKINLVSGENDMTWDAGITPIAIDLNGDGKVDGISELFGGNAKGAGFAQLASYDSNGDGVVNTADGHFGDLRIWQDKNGDHQTDGNELMTLAQAGVESLKVSFTELPFLDGNGNLHLERSSATLSNGNAADVTDLYLNVATADAKAAGVETQSLSGIANADTGSTAQNSGSIVNEQLLNSWLNGDQSHANGDLGVTLDAHSFLIDTASTEAAPSASVALDAPVGAEAVGHASQGADAFAPDFQAPACRLSGELEFPHPHSKTGAWERANPADDRCVTSVVKPPGSAHYWQIELLPVN